MTYHKTGYARGEASAWSTLRTQQVIDIFLSDAKADYLAAVYKVSRATIYRIKGRKIWSHITKDIRKNVTRINAIRLKDVRIK